MSKSLDARLLKLEERIKTTQKIHAIVDLNEYTIFVDDDDPSYQRYYVPEPTGLILHKSTNQVTTVMGAMGSGKSVMCAADIIFKLCDMPICLDGIRRSKWAVIRNTYGDYMRTTRKTWFDWFDRLGVVREVKVPEYVITHEFNALVIKGNEKKVVQCILELLPIALDHIADVPRRLKSLEVTGVYLNELAELIPDVLGYFKGRLPRYPGKNLCKTKYWSGIIADTNPPPVKSWIYNMFEVDKPRGHVMLRQPPALIWNEDIKYYVINPLAENVKNQPAGADYWLTMIQGQTDEWIKVFALGEYGILSYNQIVYKAYNDNLHSVQKVEIEEDCPLILAVDLGSHCPACLITQLNSSGQLIVFKEFWGNFIQIGELFEQFVIPWLNKHCRKMKIEIFFYDPANTLNGAEQLENLGFIVYPGYTNHIRPRLNAVSCVLTKLVGSGKPQIIISRDGCPKLREGFLGEYHYRLMRVIGETRYTEEPDKNSHPHSDLHDCLQYICLYVVDILKLDVHTRETDKESNYLSKMARYNADNTTGY